MVGCANSNTCWVSKESARILLIVMWYSGVEVCYPTTVLGAKITKPGSSAGTFIYPSYVQDIMGYMITILYCMCGNVLFSQ